MADIMTKTQRSLTMSRIRGKNTKPELKVRKYLFQKGFRYRINDKRFPGHPDIVLKSYKTIIFVNGCFWHHHENCKTAVYPKSNVEYWYNKIQRNIERDIENISQLDQMGYKVFVLWECEINKRFEEKMAEIVEYLNNAKEKR